MNPYLAVIAKKRTATGGGGGIITDDFNRADGALGANWTTDSSRTGLTIVSNQVKGTTGSVHNVAVYTASGTIAANQYAQCTVKVADYVGVVLRSDGAGTFYCCFYAPSGGNMTIYKSVAGISEAQV